MQKNDNEMKKIYIKCIKELSYDFSLEEIEQIYQLVQWCWHKSPIVEKKYQENYKREL
jgi:hypothetical protein